MSRKFAVIEIGGTKLQFALGDGTGVIAKRLRFHVDKARGAEGIRARIAEVLPPLVGEHDAAGVAAGFGGPVDWRSGRIARSHQIEGWSDFELGPWLEQIAGVPAVVDNDANVAALGEAWRGAGAGMNPVFYVTLGSGVGGGLVVEGKIFHGATPGESELGHVRLDKSGVIVEQRCSGWAVDRRIRRLREEGVKSLLVDWLPATPGGEAKLLAKALTAGDTVAQQVLNEAAEDLAFALSHVTHLVHPQVVVVGGGLSLVGELLRVAVASALPRFVMEVFHGGPAVRLAALGEDAVPVGALLLAGQRLGAGA